MKNYIIYFLTGGIITTLIVALEESGLRLWSGLAALVPVFTLVSYVFIGSSQGGEAVKHHSAFVLFGTLVSWIPYMIVVTFLANRLGPQRAIITGLVVFFILATVYLLVVNHYKLFQ